MTTNGTGTTTGRKPADAPIGTSFDKGIESAFAMGGAALNLWKTLSDDWLALSRAQLETNLQLVRSLAECRDPAAAAPLLVDNAQATVSRYISAATKASSTVSRLTSAALAESSGARGAGRLGAD
jgi:hypothetical protein